MLSVVPARHVALRVYLVQDLVCIGFRGRRVDMDFAVLGDLRQESVQIRPLEYLEGGVVPGDNDEACVSIVPLLLSMHECLIKVQHDGQISLLEIRR